MANTTIGQAYVQILPSMKGMSRAITSGGKSEVTSAGNSLGSGLGKSIVGTLTKVVTAAGIGSVISTSISEGGKLQQSLGGVETLFGDAAETVKKNASNAWKTAGMSANEYMEQTTSFAASLVSAVGGNTQKAAELADVAMQDMSDNANKMGTDMTSITNAYQGFAKQNYTMLDNLKLGYGGTQAEMQRLIKDASEMTDVQKELGVSVDSTSMSYDNIVQAIHVVQESMKINGTTAKEAATTLTGSVSMMKAAWTDFLGQMSTGGDLSEPLQNLLTSVGTVAANIIPMVGNIVKGIWDMIANTDWGEMVNTAYENVQQSVKEIDFGQIWEQALDIAGGMGDALTGLTDKIASFIGSIDWGGTAQTLWSKLSELVTSVDYASLLESAATLIGAAVPAMIDWIFGAGAGAVDFAQSIFEKLKETIAGIDWSGILEAAKQGLSSAGDFLTGIFNNIGDTAAGIDWASVWETIKNTFTAAVDIASSIFSWLQEALSAIDWGQLWESITSAGSGIVESLQNMLSGIDIGNILNGLMGDGAGIVDKLKEWFGNIEWSSIFESLMGGFENLGDIASGIFDKGVELINGINWEELGRNIFEFLTQAVIAAFVTLQELQVKVIELLANVDWVELATSILTFLAEALLAGMEIVAGAIEGIFAGIADTLGLGDLASDLSDAWGDMKESASEGWSNIKSKVSDGIKNAKDKVSDFKKNASKTFGEAISAMNKKAGGIKDAAKTIKDKFGDIKDSITDKLEGARKKVKEIIDKIRGLFDFNWSLPTLKVPHISVDGGEAPWGIGGMGHLPSFNVTWAAKGGILDGATLVGAGEAGKEALLPLERNTGWMDTLADRISTKGDTVINVSMTVNGSDSPEEWGQRFVTELNRQVRMGVV